MCDGVGGIWRGCKLLPEQTKNSRDQTIILWTPEDKVNLSSVITFLPESCGFCLVTYWLYLFNFGVVCGVSVYIQGAEALWVGVAEMMGS